MHVRRFLANHLRIGPAVALALLFIGLGPVPAAETRAPVPERMRPGFESITAVDSAAFLEFIAADELEGRDTPSRGQSLARKYVRSLYKSWGVAPFGDARASGPRSHEQALPMFVKAYGPGTAMTVRSGGLTRTFRMGGDFTYSNGADWSGAIDGRVVFAGYGVSAPDLGYDDFAGIDVRGKIVLVAAGRPGGDERETVFTGPEHWARFAGRRTPVENCARLLAGRGALALVVADPSFDRPARPQGYVQGARISSASNRVVSPPIAAADPMTPTFWVSPRLADALLVAAGTSLGERTRKIDAVLKPSSLDIPGLTMTIDVDVALQASTCANLLGVIEGSDPDLRNEYVIVGAHLDHIGLNDDGHVFNGADDNGSGSVGVLQIAKALALNPTKPRRSVILAHWTGEEKGLLGSLAFVKEPSIPLNTIKACVNLDMIGRETTPQAVKSQAAEFHLSAKARAEIGDDPRRLLMVYVPLFAPGLGALVTELSDAHLGLNVVLLPSAPMIGNSDHYFFALEGIPSLFLFTGGHSDAHQPTDTVDRIDAEKMADVVRLAYLTVYAAADSPGPWDGVRLP
ncbi:MAG: M20/M25/M40 family metallo-hydrolase [Candidatus Aminicenantes bacterium]|nr:M20/M25/M40 family metallo-hydrolase [Candidatus Aminicenantes bacterium]